MRKFYPAIALLFLSLQAGAQSSNIVWHSQGQVYSSGDGNANTSLYIGGDMKVSASTSPSAPSTMTIENSRVKLTGNLINDVLGQNSGSLFALPNSNVGVFEFCGTTKQEITSSGTVFADIPSKLYNYINFPNLDINNTSGDGVTLNARLAAKTQNIDLKNGWFVLGSELADPVKDGGASINGDKESILAHLLVEGTIDYHKADWLTKSVNQRGKIQVNLKVPSDGPTPALNKRSLIGFGSPFKKIYTDYFMFNTLLQFTPSGLVAWDPFTSNPGVTLDAGKGYLLGIDLRGEDPQNYPIQPEYQATISFAQRAKDGYEFNRFAFSTGSHAANQIFGIDNAALAANAYQLEEINIDNIPFVINKGYNYLSNPFTSPLSIEALLASNLAATNPWGVHSDEWAVSTSDVWNRVWVLAPSSNAVLSDINIERSYYTYNYQVAMNTGGTYTNGEDENGVLPGPDGTTTAIAPLQMFVLYGRKDGVNLTIPKSERVMGTTRFLRNAPLKNKRVDDFIIEFRDMKTKTSDRVSFVLRPQAQLSAYKNVNRSVSSSTSDVVIKPAAGDDFLQSYASQIYTKDATGNSLMVQFLPLETTSRIQLYHIPSIAPQEIHITGQRIKTKVNAQRMWLQDYKEDKIIEITPDMIYETYSEPTDSRERFAILFSNDDLGIGDQGEESSNIYAYSKVGDIFVKGFAEVDFGTVVGLYDMNGRLLAQKNVDNENILLSQGCASGVYLIKLNGKLNKTIKLIVQ